MSRMPPTAVRRQRGLTIVELLVALVMGLVLLGGVITVFVANKETYRVQDAVARAQETGRFALSLVTRDLQRAGLTGCDSLAPRDPPRNTLSGAFVVRTDGLTAAADSRWYGQAFYMRPVEAFEVDGDDDFSGTSSGWAPALDRHFTDSPAVSPQPVLGSDILLVRVPDGDPLPVDSSVQPASSSSPITVFGGNDLAVNDVVIVSDCEYAAVFQVTGVAPASGSRTAVTPNGDLQKKFPSLVTPAELQRYRTTAYYVAPGASGEPALWRWNGTKRTGDPVEVAEGVESLQVRFGVDDNLDQAVDRYESADDLATADWENVISARITVVVVSDDTSVAPEPAPYVVPGEPNPITVTPNDRRLRQVFTSTVNLRNRTS